MISDRTMDPMDPRPACCGARTRQGGECGQLAMANGRCRFHGGLSTGPRTEDGMRRLRAAVTTHGNRSAAAREFRALVREMRANARRICETV